MSMENLNSPYVKKSFDIFLLYLYNKFCLVLEVLYKRNCYTKGAAHRLIDGYIRKNLEFMSAAFLNRRNQCSRKQKLPYFDVVQQLCNKCQLDYRLSDGCFHKNLAVYQSNSFLKIIFKHCHSNLNAIYSNGLCNNVVTLSKLHFRLLIQLTKQLLD